MEGIDDGQNTPRGHPDFNSYVKNSMCFHMERTDEQTDEQTGGEIYLLRMGRLEELFSSCGFVSVFGSGGK